MFHGKPSIHHKKPGAVPAPLQHKAVTQSTSYWTSGSAGSLHIGDAEIPFKGAGFGNLTPFSGPATPAENEFSTKLFGCIAVIKMSVVKRHFYGNYYKEILRVQEARAKAVIVVNIRDEACALELPPENASKEIVSIPVISVASRFESQLVPGTKVNFRNIAALNVGPAVPFKLAEFGTLSEFQGLTVSAGTELDGTTRRVSDKFSGAIAVVKLTGNESAILAAKKAAAEKAAADDLTEEEAAPEIVGAVKDAIKAACFERAKMAQAASAVAMIVVNSDSEYERKNDEMLDIGLPDAIETGGAVDIEFDKGDIKIPVLSVSANIGRQLVDGAQLHFKKEVDLDATVGREVDFSTGKATVVDLTGAEVKAKLYIAPALPFFRKADFGVLAPFQGVTVATDMELGDPISPLSAMQMSGAVAVITVGDSTSSAYDKAKAAQDAKACAVIILNTEDKAQEMGLDDVAFQKNKLSEALGLDNVALALGLPANKVDEITIPVLSVASRFSAQLANGAYVGFDVVGALDVRGSTVAFKTASFGPQMQKFEGRTIDAEADLTDTIAVLKLPPLFPPGDLERLCYNKAKMAQNANAAAMIVVNNKEEVLELAAPRGKAAGEITVPVISVPSSLGNQLLAGAQVNFQNLGSLQVKGVEVPFRPADFGRQSPFSGVATLMEPASSKGGKVPLVGKIAVLRLSNSKQSVDSCFAEAKRAQDEKAVAIIVVNNVDEPLALPLATAARPLQIPVMSVSYGTGRQFVEGVDVSFEEGASFRSNYFE